MRPQLFAADHTDYHFGMLAWPEGFNEAAAIRCGSLAFSLLAALAAESFNEAAAIRCGSRGNLPPRIIPTHGFNEAAAIRCGSRVDAGHLVLVAMVASMRPQLFAADHRAEP